MSYQQYELPEVTSIYVTTRPDPPEELIKSIIDQLTDSCPVNVNTGKWSNAVDVGCGSGQLTFLLANYFDRVIGYDISESQIAQANQRNQLDNVTFKVSPSETIPLTDRSVDLITVCEALHFFNIEKFMDKVYRLLKPGGLFVAIGYYVIPKLTKLDNPTVNLDVIGDLVDRAKQTWHNAGFPCIVFAEHLKTKYQHLGLPFEKLIHEGTFVTSFCRPATFIIDLINSLGASALFRAAHLKEDADLMAGIISDLKSILETDDLTAIQLKATFTYFTLTFNMK